MLGSWCITCPHDYRCHSWKNATQIPSNDRAAHDREQALLEEHLLVHAVVAGAVGKRDRRAVRVPKVAHEALVVRGGRLGVPGFAAAVRAPFDLTPLVVAVALATMLRGQLARHLAENASAHEVVERSLVAAAGGSVPWCRHAHVP